MIRNKSGDTIFLNVDNTKKIRFYINNHLHENAPHAHIEHKYENVGFYLLVYNLASGKCIKDYHFFHN
jgi:hypothetical protein